MKKLLAISFGTTILLSQTSTVSAKTEKSLRYNGLSSPTLDSPSKNLLCGTNNAWAMSGDTEGSIYGNLGKAAGLEDSEIMSLRLGDKRMKEKLTKLFGTTTAICRVTIEPNGQIQNVLIKQSSGSQLTDQKVMNFVKSAGPFSSNNFPEALSWTIEVPTFIIKSDW